MQFRNEKLDNGLEIIAECNEHAYSTALAFFVKAGSRDETAEISGVSHFLEHMVFKGTPRRSAADVNRELDELGSHSNAFTSEEQTVFYSTVLPEYQTDVLDLLADIMRPSLREEDFETEKKVIIEEIYKYEDQPPFGAHEKCMAHYFGDHPLGKNILGTVDTVGNLTPQQMRSYFQSRYSPSNIVLAASGKIDFESLVSSANDLCGGWEAFSADRVTSPCSAKSGFSVIEKETASQAYIVKISAGPQADHADRFANRVLSTIVGDDTGSRFYWDLIDSGLAEYAGIGPYEFQGTGITMTYVCCSPDNAQKTIDIAHQIQSKIQSEGITNDELELAKSKICSHLVRQSERPSNRLFSIGNGWIQRRGYSTISERLEKYRSITREDIHRIIERYPLTDSTTVVVGPKINLNPPS